jgi:hypothetical protein
MEAGESCGADELGSKKFPQEFRRGFAGLWLELGDGGFNSLPCTSKYNIKQCH